MLGALITFAFAAGATGIGLWILRRWTSEWDPALRLGVAGLTGLGAIGLLTLPIGLLPEGLHWGLWLIVALGALGWASLVTELRRNPIRIAKPEGSGLLVVVLGIATLFALIGALAPSDSLDWDSLAYHLAVPKLWLAAGHSSRISFIHHSNFPFTVDNLYIWGMSWGGQSGAKAFSVAFLVLGQLALFGFSRERYGKVAGWLSALAFATIPVVLWESGTAYIDVANGLYVGLGVVFACRALQTMSAGDRWLAIIMLGFGAGSKYTGLQTIFAVGLVLLCAGFLKKRGAEGTRLAFAIGLGALALASPWYIKNAVVAGNPVYPFFFERFGGKDWDSFSAKIYTEEQQTFGVGKGEHGRNPGAIGHAVLGLAYQPGRYTNPGATDGQGFPVAAIGFAIVAAGLAWCFSGKSQGFEGAVLAVVGISLLMWFFLSQQSRYVVPLSVPLAVLAGGALKRFKGGVVVAAAIGLQAAYSLFLIYTLRTQTQLQVISGKIPVADYLAMAVPFKEPSDYINENVKDGRVALYDEVFGYFLDVPYFWATPGHSTEIPYASLNSGKELVDRWREMGFTHVYVNLQFQDRTFIPKWIKAMGLQGSPEPFTSDEKAEMSTDIRKKWRVLVAEAVASGDLVLEKQFRGSLLFRLRQ